MAQHCKGVWSFVSQPEVSLVEILREIREVGAELKTVGTDTATIKAHLKEIDSQLETMPQRKEVDEMRAMVEELQTAVTAIEEFVNGDPPLQDRLIALEENVAQFKIDTEEREADLAADAGTANDAEHRASSRHQADKAVAAQEALTRVELNEIKTRLNIISQELSNLSGITLIIIGIAALILAVLVNIGWQAFV